jgi:hypothetical protein
MIFSVLLRWFNMKQEFQGRSNCLLSISVLDKLLLAFVCSLLRLWPTGHVIIVLCLTTLSLDNIPLLLSFKVEDKVC